MRAGNDRSDESDADENNQERREKPFDPTGVEIGCIETAGALYLRENQSGDQVAGKHEEDIHADVSALHPRNVRMRCENEKDGQRSEALQIGAVRQVFWHGLWRLKLHEFCNRIYWVQPG